MMGLQIPCGPGITCSSIFGYLTIIMAFVIFVGSVYLVLSAVFGVKMGYLVLAVAFFGWMILFSAIWAFGTGAPNSNNLGPRGTEPHWQALGAGLTVASDQYPVVNRYPNPPWKALGPGVASSVQEVQTSIQEFMANQANQELHLLPTAVNALQTTDFTVENIRFATQDKVSLAAGTAFYNFGGPRVTVFVRHDSGDVPVYSWAFFAASIFGFLIHLPFLDKAERRRKAVLTGGQRPPWYGPA
jgi:hypothetical protein